MQINHTGPFVAIGPVEDPVLPIATLSSATPFPVVSTRPAGASFSLETQTFGDPDAGDSGRSEVGMPMPRETIPLAGFEPLGIPPRKWIKLAELLPPVIGKLSRVMMMEEGSFGRKIVADTPELPLSTPSTAGDHAASPSDLTSFSPLPTPVADIRLIRRPEVVLVPTPQPTHRPGDVPAEPPQRTTVAAKVPAQVAFSLNETEPEKTQHIPGPGQARQGIAVQHVAAARSAEGAVIPKDGHSRPQARPDISLAGVTPMSFDGIEVRHFRTSEVVRHVSIDQFANSASPPVLGPPVHESHLPGAKRKEDRLAREAAQAAKPVDVSRATKAPPAGSLPAKIADHPSPVPEPTARASTARAQGVRSDVAAQASAVQSSYREDSVPRHSVETVAVSEVRPPSRHEERRSASPDRQGANTLRTDTTVAPSPLLTSPKSLPTLDEPASLTPEYQLDAAVEEFDSLHASAPGKSDPPVRAAELDHRPAVVARGAVTQIAEAVRLPMDGSVEVRLSPDELGRVKLTMIPGEAGLVVQLVAERPETLELLRRHVDTLAADLRDLGYSDLEFSFHNEGAERRGEEDSLEGATAGLSDAPLLAEPVDSRHPRGLASDGRLDIRL